MSHEILEKCQDTDKLVLIGIKTRGAILAKRIAEKIKQNYKIEVPIAALDISNYRDDLPPTGNPTGITINLQNKIVILIDDVLYTGRTIRAALDAIIEHGRPSLIQLMVLVDRGHREFPIRPDYIGKNVPTAKSEEIVVAVKEVDGAEFIGLK